MADFVSGIRPITPTYPVKPVRPADKEREQRKQPQDQPPPDGRESDRDDDESGDKPKIDEHV